MQPAHRAGVPSQPGVEAPVLPFHRGPGTVSPGGAGVPSQPGVEAPVVPHHRTKVSDVRQQQGGPVAAQPGAPAYADAATRFARVDPAAEDAAQRAAAAAKLQAKRQGAVEEAPWSKADSLTEELERRHKLSTHLNAPGVPYDPICNQYAAGSAGARLAAADAEAGERASVKAASAAARSDTHGYNLITNAPQQAYVPVPGACSDVLLDGQTQKESAVL